MNYKYIIILLSLFGLVTNSHAADWVKLHENSYSKLMLEKDSIVQQDLLKKVWVKIEYKAPQKNIDSLDKEYNLSKLLWFFDCSVKKSATSQVFQYYDSELVYSAGVDIKSVEFIEPAPETDVDTAMRYVCKTGKANTVTQNTKPVLANAAAEKNNENNNQKLTPNENTKEEKPPKSSATAEPEQKQNTVKNFTKPVIAPEKLEEKLQEKSAGKAKLNNISTNSTKWGYQRNISPENWSKLSKTFATCNSGGNQSPINIKNALQSSLKPVRTLQKFPAKDIFNNGLTVQVSFNEGNMLVLDNAAYQMKNVSFHAPSEHTMNDQYYPLEAHFLHVDHYGNITIVGVMFEEGKPNSGLEKLWSEIPKINSEPVKLKDRTLPSELMPKNRNYYRYSGSLTTPPCSEGVRWLMMKTPMTASAAQIAKFEKAIKSANNRPLQALNGRIIVE